MWCITWIRVAAKRFAGSSRLPVALASGLDAIGGEDSEKCPLVGTWQGMMIFCVGLALLIPSHTSSHSLGHPRARRYDA